MARTPWNRINFRLRQNAEKSIFCHVRSFSSAIGNLNDLTSADRPERRSASVVSPGETSRSASTGDCRRIFASTDRFATAEFRSHSMSVASLRLAERDALRNVVDDQRTTRSDRRSREQTGDERIAADLRLVFLHGEVQR